MPLPGSAFSVSRGTKLVAGCGHIPILSPARRGLPANFDDTNEPFRNPAPGRRLFRRQHHHSAAPSPPTCSTAASASKASPNSWATPAAKPPSATTQNCCQAWSAPSSTTPTKRPPHFRGHRSISPANDRDTCNSSPAGVRHEQSTSPTADASQHVSCARSRWSRWKCARRISIAGGRTRTSRFTKGRGAVARPSLSYLPGFLRSAATSALGGPGDTPVRGDRGFDVLSAGAAAAVLQGVR